MVVNYSTRSDDAQANSDYRSQTGQLTIPRGATQRNVVLQILEDNQVEGDEEVFIDFEIVSGATFADETNTSFAVVNIQDDDSAISLGVTGSDFTAPEGNDGNPSSFFFSLDRFGDIRGNDTVEIAITPTGDNPIEANDLVNGSIRSKSLLLLMKVVK